MLDAQGMAGRIIGKGGETIKAIQERTGAKVQVLEEGTKVRIAGDPGQVDAATAEVEQVIEESKEYFANKDARRAAAGNGGGGSVVVGRIVVVFGGMVVVGGGIVVSGGGSSPQYFSSHSTISSRPSP